MESIELLIDLISLSGPSGISLSNLWEKYTNEIKGMKRNHQPLDEFTQSYFLEELKNLDKIKLIKMEQNALQLIASESQRNLALGLFDPSILNPLQRRILEYIAEQRENGVSQPNLSKNLKIDPRYLHYHILTLTKYDLIKRKELKFYEENSDSLSGRVITFYLRRFFNIEEELDAVDVKKIETFFYKYIEQAKDHVVIEAELRKSCPFHLKKHSFDNIRDALIEKNLIERFDAQIERYGNQKLITMKCLKLKEKQASISSAPPVNEGTKTELLGEISNSNSTLSSTEEMERSYCSKKSQLRYELPLFHQIYKVIKASGTNGITQNELHELFPVSSKLLYLGLTRHLQKKLDISSILVRENKTSAYRYYTKENFPSSVKTNVQDSSSHAEAKSPPVTYTSRSNRSLSVKRTEAILQIISEHPIISLSQARHTVERQEGKTIDHKTFSKLSRDLENQNKLKIVNIGTPNYKGKVVYNLIMAAPHIDIASKEFKDYVATLNPDLGKTRDIPVPPPKPRDKDIPSLPIISNIEFHKSGSKKVMKQFGYINPKVRRISHLHKLLWQSIFSGGKTDTRFTWTETLNSMNVESFLAIIGTTTELSLDEYIQAGTTIDKLPPSVKNALLFSRQRLSQRFNMYGDSLIELKLVYKLPDQSLALKKEIGFIDPISPKTYYYTLNSMEDLERYWNELEYCCYFSHFPSIPRAEISEDENPQYYVPHGFTLFLENWKVLTSSEVQYFNLQTSYYFENINLNVAVQLAKENNVSISDILQYLHKYKTGLRKNQKVSELNSFLNPKISEGEKTAKKPNFFRFINELKGINEENKKETFETRKKKKRKYELAEKEEIEEEERPMKKKKLSNDEKETEESGNQGTKKKEEQTEPEKEKRRRSNWTRAEDDLLISCILNFNVNGNLTSKQWNEVSQDVGKSVHHCRTRYKYLKEEENGTLPIIEEDRILDIFAIPKTISFEGLLSKMQIVEEEKIVPSQSTAALWEILKILRSKDQTHDYILKSSLKNYYEKEIQVALVQMYQLHVFSPKRAAIFQVPTRELFEKMNSILDEKLNLSQIDFPSNNHSSSFISQTLVQLTKGNIIIDPVDIPQGKKLEDLSNIPFFNFKISHSPQENSSPTPNSFWKSYPPKNPSIDIKQIVELEHLSTEEETYINQLYEEIQKSTKFGKSEKELTTIKCPTKLRRKLLDILLYYRMVVLVNGFQEKLFVDYSFLKAWTFVDLNILVCPWIQLNGKIDEHLVTKLRTKILYELSNTLRLTLEQISKLFYPYFFSPSIEDFLNILEYDEKVICSEEIELPKKKKSNYLFDEEEEEEKEDKMEMEDGEGENEKEKIKAYFPLPHSLITPIQNFECYKKPYLI